MRRTTSCPAAACFQEEAVEDLEVSRPVELPGLEAQLGQNGPHQLRRRDHRVQDERGLVARPELREDCAADGGLAGPDLSGDLDEALAFPDPEEDVVERLAMFVGEKEEPGVGRDVERRLAEAVEVVVHRPESLPPFRARRAGGQEAIASGRQSAHG